MVSAAVYTVTVLPERPCLGVKQYPIKLFAKTEQSRAAAEVYKTNVPARKTKKNRISPTACSGIIWSNKCSVSNIIKHKVFEKANLSENVFYHLLLTCYQLFGLILVCLNFNEAV